MPGFPAASQAFKGRRIGEIKVFDTSCLLNGTSQLGISALAAIQDKKGSNPSMGNVCQPAGSFHSATLITVQGSLAKQGVHF